MPESQGGNNHGALCFRAGPTEAWRGCASGVSECDGDGTPSGLWTRTGSYVHDKEAHCDHKALVEARRCACVDFGTRAG